MKKFLNILITTILAIILLANMSLAVVTESEIQEKQNEQSNISGSIKNIEGKIEDVEQEKNNTISEVNNLTNQIDNYQDEIDELDVQISKLESDIQKAEIQIKEDEEKYKAQQELLNERLVAIYENGEVSYLDVLLSANSIIDFLSGYYLVSEITKYDNELLDKIENEKQKIEAEKSELEENKSSLDTSKKTKEAKENALKVARKEKENKVGELSQTEKDLEKQLDELKAHENSIKSQVQKLKEEYDRQLKSSASSSSSNGTSSYGFRWPLANIYITTPYKKPGSWSAGYHTGIDLRAADGTSVYSVGDGQVIEAGWAGSYGYCVGIYHGNNIYSLYAHASSIKVSVGQKVTKGQVIMLSGHSGNAFGPHLHFEIRTPYYKYANNTNPLNYLP